MRIWAFPAFYPYDRPGKKWSGIFAHRQYKRLIDCGAELSVIEPVPWHPPTPFHHFHDSWKTIAELNYPLQRVYDEIKVYHPRISNPRPSRLAKGSPADRYADAVVEFFRSHKIRLDPQNDIFYSQFLPESYKVQIAAKRLNVRSAVLAIGDDVISWPHESPENIRQVQEVWKGADIRLAVAGYLAKEANKILGEDLPYTVVRRGVEYDHFKPANAVEKAEARKQFDIPQDKFIILCIGSAIQRKGWLDLLDALVNIKKLYPQVRLVGVHAGVGTIDLAENAKKRGVDDIFINMGEVEPAQMNKLYNAADLFCLVSHWEGIANAVVEAMSSGLPVLTTNVSGHPELLKNGATGIMIDPKQPLIVERELKKLIDDARYRDVLGNNARDFIVKEWGSFADNAALLYKRLQIQAAV